MEDQDSNKIDSSKEELRSVESEKSKELHYSQAVTVPEGN